MLSVPQQETELVHLYKIMLQVRTHYTMICLYIPQQITETATMNVVEILPNTMMSFLNMRTASAPIQNTEARVKYWIRTEAIVQPMVFSVRSTPMTHDSNMRNMARQSWMLNLLASRFRSFLFAQKLQQINSKSL